MYSIHSIQIALVSTSQPYHHNHQIPGPGARWWKLVGFEEPLTGNHLPGLPEVESAKQFWAAAWFQHVEKASVSNQVKMMVIWCHLRISLPCFTCLGWENDTPDSETLKRMKREVPILLHTVHNCNNSPNSRQQFPPKATHQFSGIFLCCPKSAGPNQAEVPWTGLKRRRPTCPWQQCADRLPKHVYLRFFLGERRRELEKDSHDTIPSRRNAQRNKRLTFSAIPTLCGTYSFLQRLPSRSPFWSCIFFCGNFVCQPTQGTSGATWCRMTQNLETSHLTGSDL